MNNRCQSQPVHLHSLIKTSTDYENTGKSSFCDFKIVGCVIRLLTILEEFFIPYGLGNVKTCLRA